MPSTKKEAFNSPENELAELAKALSHPARVAILKALATRKSCVCGEIVEVLPLSQSTVSQHLKALKEAGFIDGTIEGAKSCYCINWAAFRRFEAVFASFFIETRFQGAASKCC